MKVQVFCFNFCLISNSIPPKPHVYRGIYMFALTFTLNRQYSCHQMSLSIRNLVNFANNVRQWS